MAFPSHKLVTLRSGNTDGLIACRVPDTNGSHTTSTRRLGSDILLKMLLCTQLAPARHVPQVGDNKSSNRGCPASRLNSDFNVEILVREMTRPLGALDRLSLEATEVHEASTTTADSATATARPERSPSRRQHRMRRMTAAPSASSRMPPQR